MKKLFDRISYHLLNNMASVVLFMAIFAAGARCMTASHEPKVPARLRKD